MTMALDDAHERSDARRDTALVTGAAHGIGRAVCVELMSRGLRVVAVDIDEDALKVLEDEVLASGAGAITWHAVDVGDRRAIRALGEQVGGITYLVHCAGVSPRTPTLDMTDDEWDNVFAINLTSAHTLATTFAPGMMARGKGRIILLASDRALYGAANGAHYAASKAGIVAYTKSLALELGSSNVTINAVNPGTTDTGMARTSLSQEQWEERVRKDPLGRISLPAEVAGLIGYLICEAGDFMTGQLVTVRMRAG